MNEEELNFWMRRVERVRISERKAISRAAELQRENEILKEKLSEIRVLLEKSIDITIKQ